MTAEAQLSPRRHARGLSTSFTASSVSSCSASTSPQGERKGRPSWVLHENRRLDSRRPSRLTAPLHRTSGPSDREVSLSPPSSPLPLPHNFNQPPINDFNTKDDQQRCRDISGRQCQRGRMGFSSHFGTCNVGIASSSAAKECRSLGNSYEKQLTSDVGDMKRANGNSDRPRFFVSTTSSPRPQTYPTRPQLATKTCSKDVPLYNISNRSSSKLLLREESVPSTCISRSKPDFYQRTCSSKVKSNNGSSNEATLTKSTRISALRSQTAITTTTTTTTHKVASTTITLGPLHEGERYKRANNSLKTSSLRRKKLVAQDVNAVDKQDPTRGAVLDATAANPSDTSHSLENTATVTPPADARELRAPSNSTSLPLDMDNHQELEPSSQDLGPIAIRIHLNATAEAATAHSYSSTGPSSPTSLAPKPDALSGTLSKASADGYTTCPPCCGRPCADVFQSVSATTCASLTPPTSPTLANNPRIFDVVGPGRSHSTTKPQDSAKPQEPAECTTVVFPEYGFMKEGANTASDIDLPTSTLTMAKDSAAISLYWLTVKEQKVLYHCRDRAEGGIRRYASENHTTADSTLPTSKCVDTGGCSVHPDSKYHDKNSDRQPCNNRDNEQVNDNSNDTSNDNDGYAADSSKDEKCPLKAAALTHSRPQLPRPAVSTPAGITLRDKMQFLKNQEMRSSSVKKWNQFVSADVDKALLPAISNPIPSMPRQQPQERSRSTPTLLFDFPSSLFSAKRRNAPIFSARTLASLAPAVTTGLSSSAATRETKSKDLSFASVSSTVSLPDAVITTPTPQLSLTRSLSSPRREDVLLRPKFIRPRMPLFERSDNPQVPSVMKETQSPSPAPVTATAWRQALPRDQFRELAPPLVTLVGKQESTQDVSRGILTRPSAMSSTRTSLAGDSETEELCYFSLPIRSSAHSPCSVSPLHLGRLPLIAEYQEQVQDGGSRAGDISILASRFANLRVMDLLCPIQNASSVQEHDGVWMDASWAAQISQLLNYLADKADPEEEERGVCFATESSSSRQWLRVSGGAGHLTPTGHDSERSGLYRQILQDWLMRLNQLSGEVFETHSGLKRDVDKIRWQHNVTSVLPLPLH